MACTPRKLVHWSTDNEVNEFVYGSPYSDASSSDSINSTSTLSYINSQLIAHGFARGTGVSMEGLSKEDMEKMTKCLLGMLSQRVEDMARAEDLSTKLRTLSYEHERLSSMHRTTEEQLASSERETNVYKSRLSASNKTIQSTEASYKATTAELQRTRTALQSLRQTHAAELKRREKETEKLLERWQKISDVQTKLGTVAAGLKCKPTHANPLTDSRGNDAISGGGSGGARGPDLMEDALEEAQAARKELIEENTSLKNVVLSAANEIARVTRSVRMKLGTTTAGDGCDDENQHLQQQQSHQKLVFSDLFSVAAPESASDRFVELLSSFRDAINQIGNDIDVDPEPQSIQVPSPTTARKPKDENKEIQRLQNTIVDLRRQLEQAQTQKQSSAYADQAQEIIRKFVNDDNEKTHVQERRVLEKIRKELDHARKKVDEAALTLRDEKDTLEEERQAFHREQHLWRSRMGILHDGDEEEGAKPATGLAAYFDAPAEPLDIPAFTESAAVAPPASPLKSARKPKRARSPAKQHTAAASPRKQLGKSTIFAVGKVKTSSKKAHGVGGGSTPKKAKALSSGGNGKLGGGPALGASTVRRARVIPPMETEVLPSHAPKASSSSSSSLAAMTMASPPMMTPGVQSLIVAEAFTLPPLTPLTSIPPEEDILSSLGSGGIGGPDFGASGDLDDFEREREADTTAINTKANANVAKSKSKAVGGEPGPSKKTKKPFPVAKPLAQRMIHAYSPARPSPLSRFVDVARSPSPSVRSDGGSELDSDDAEADGEKNRYAGTEGNEAGHVMTLDELALDGPDHGVIATTAEVEEDTGPAEESPLREKNLRLAKIRKTAKPPAAGPRGAGAPKMTAAAATKEKLKGARAERDKENGAGTRGKRAATDTNAAAGKDPSKGGVAAKPTGTGAGRGGARRVPIGSVDAAPIGRAGWK